MIVMGLGKWSMMIKKISLKFQLNIYSSYRDIYFFANLNQTFISTKGDIIMLKSWSHLNVFVNYIFF